MKAPHFLSLAFCLILAFSCHKRMPDQPDPTPAPTARLKDMTERNLPSPSYHFEYTDSGAVSKINLYSGLLIYDVVYTGKKVLRLDRPLFKETLQYEYTNGDLSFIRLINKDGVNTRRYFVTFSTSHQLQEVEWQVKEGNIGYLIEKTLQFSYYPDGNLMDLRYHLYANDSTGQKDAVYTERYSNYDTHINADGFSLLHPFQLEHLVFLPDFKLQLNNPQRVVRTGNGITYEANYTYTYDAAGKPLTKTGDILWTSGADNGKHFQSLETFSWY